nr:acyltransferase family protein [Lacrimispora amygdalina]
MSNSAINGDHREAWIDCARGIAILLVIVGHTVSGVLSGAIYSFHMPLFFIFSGITSKFSSTNEEFATKTKRSFKRLMGPFFLIDIIQTVIYLLRHLFNIFQDGSFLMNYLEQRILSGIFSSGVSISVLNATVLYVGVIWFFPAIFLGKSLFDYLHLKLTNRQLPLYCLLFSILGVLIGQIQPLPFSFDIVLAILPLFYVGSHFDRFQVKESPFKKFFLYSFCGDYF